MDMSWRRRLAARGGLLLAAALTLAGCATTPPPRSEPAVAERSPEAAAPAVAVAQPAPLVPEPESLPEAPVSRRSLSLDDFAQTNDDKLLQVYVGMALVRVERLMDGHQSGKWINPYKRQMLHGRDGRNYEVLFYLTSTPLAGRRVTENLLTPVIVRDDKVVAIGRYPLKKLRRGDCLGRGANPCS